MERYYPRIVTQTRIHRRKSVDSQLKFSLLFRLFVSFAVAIGSRFEVSAFCRQALLLFFYIVRYSTRSGTSEWPVNYCSIECR